MTAVAAQPTDNVEHPSGKGRSGENFPVGSWLIPAPLRPHVHAFYRFARMADDVADASDLVPEEKVRRLDRMAEVLDGADGDADAPAAAAMARSLKMSGVASIHCHELLAAFRQDALKNRYDDWADLMAYCRLSAAPVGRYLLDLHGENRDTWPAADSLCAALQVLNHLQDCGDDYRQLDRVYLPADIMAAEGCSLSDLAGNRCVPPLRRVLDRVIDLTRPLVDQAGALPGGTANRGLRAESAVIVALAARLLDQLTRRDPLAERVKLGTFGTLLAAVTGLVRCFAGGAA
jgi:farnesyl-diphosphate farnesyltransferase